MKKDGTFSVRLKNFMRHLKVAQTIPLLPANPYIKIEKNEVNSLSLTHQQVIMAILLLMNDNNGKAIHSTLDSKP